jgi:hypothetical protein
MDYDKLALANRLLVKQAGGSGVLKAVGKAHKSLAEGGAPIAAGVWEYGVKAAPWLGLGYLGYKGSQKGSEAYKRYQYRKQLRRAQKMQRIMGGR